MTMTDRIERLRAWIEDAETWASTPEELATLEQRRAILAEATGEVSKHMGPGPHPSGSEQQAHAGSRLHPLSHPLNTQNSLASLPPEVRSKVKAVVEEHIGSTREILGRYRRLLKASFARPHEETILWYVQVHDWLEGLRQTHGKFTIEQVAGATAAMSPQLLWTAKPGKLSNKVMAESMIRNVATDPILSEVKGMDMAMLEDRLATDAEKYGYTPFRLTSKTRLSDITDHRQATLAWASILRAEGYKFGGGAGYKPFVDAMEILRGGNVEEVLDRVIDDVLTGVKRRSFYNNLLLIESLDVTIDAQMIGAARGRAINPNDPIDKLLSTTLTSTPSYKGIRLGVTPLLADHIRTLTLELNHPDSTDPWSNDLLPMQVQAAIWAEFKQRA